jgi:hypothetical protein
MSMVSRSDSGSCPRPVVRASCSETGERESTARAVHSPPGSNTLKAAVAVGG